MATSDTTSLPSSGTSSAIPVSPAIIKPTNAISRFEEAVSGRTNIDTDFIGVIDGAGDFSRKAGIEVLVRSLKNILVTPLRSYPFEPDYGSELHKKVFEPADETTEEEIRFEVIERANMYDSRINILSVQTQFFGNRKGFRINVTIKKGNDEVTEKIDFDESSGFMPEDG